jgi:hypothetical protein
MLSDSFILRFFLHGLYIYIYIYILWSIFIEKHFIRGIC